MTKADRYLVLNRHFIKKEDLEGNPPSILWKHRTLPNVYAFSSEYENRQENEIIFVRCKEKNLNDACKFAVKHHFQSKEELESIVTSLMPSVHKLSKETGSKEPRISQPNPFVENFYQSKQQLNSEPSYYSSGRSKSKRYTVLAIAVVISIVAMATNPSTSDHREAVKKKLSQEHHQESLHTLAEASGSDKDWDEANADQEHGLSSDTADILIPSAIDRSDYLLFSLTEARLEGKQKIIGIGLLGRVWIGNHHADEMSLQ